ncbi:3-keto-disaccharide hydrolase [Rhodohalobacter sulfatireducens]|uniref:DUF1080 domain-containing protein n=1 Tax=Rhodohalobacter sulfatireducens TaxID=2911366 RepID=A0ABS9KHH4_9BACT|nr:DUF1080 domain-containing protein [Rhodohalobacter sulfatireducens]MCG2590306.1 DUF1080 domain-containing protein [Rhodohalobacter sulfatireducens]
MKKTTIILLSIFIGMLMLPVQVLSQNWQPMFEGESFDGWTKLNGDAEYQIEGNVITGIAKLNTPNTFLATDRNYSDFIVEFDVKVDPRLNSGVQIRSESRDDYMDGRVHGYQVEIDPSKRAWSGGIYDEARRGWLYPITKNEACSDAFQNGLWNSYRIEAVGNEIKTWINGFQCSNLYDNMTSEGFIALQVHSINDEDQDGATVQWRDVKILTENLSDHRMKDDPDAEVINWVPNTLTESEKRHGWRLLWDGETTDGWRGANAETFPDRGWVIEDETLSVIESDGTESPFGDIVTEQEFSDFIFEVEFKITEGANSGIKYFVIEGLNPGSGSEIGPEYQILDNENHPDANQGVAGNRTVASLYDMITAENLSEENRDDIRFKGNGEWNKARIVAEGNSVEHWLNNVKVVEYERGSQIYRNLVQKSKYNVYENFGEAEAGHILLQDHGNRVSFRSIKIREL